LSIKGCLCDINNPLSGIKLICQKLNDLDSGFFKEINNQGYVSNKFELAERSQSNQEEPHLRGIDIFKCPSIA